MREPAVSVPIDPRIRDQLRRVRWRRRLCATQHAAYVVLAVGGIAAAMTTLAALRGGTITFVATAVPAILAVVIAIAVVTRSLWRGRLPRDRAAAWIDDTAGLRGALATLVTVRRPGPLVALLSTRNLALLGHWTPERVVPAVVPVAACLAAVAGIGALGLVLGLAPALRPPMPTLTTVEGPLVPVDATGFPTRPDRLLVGTSGSDVAGGTHDGRPAAGTDDGSAAAESTAWPVLVQERMRRALWGEEWDRVRAALARAAGAGTHADGARPTTTARNGEGRGGTAARADVSAARRAGVPDDEAARDDGTGGSGGGAGDGVDEHLFGAATDEIQAGVDPFALALAARVRTQRSGPRPPSGETPDASPDERPTLAERQRREDAAHRMSVPVAYEPIVRALYAHDEVTP